jgi:hypothetical protein
MLVALFGVLALGALTAAAAQAVEAPRWSISGTTLAEGKTHYISVKNYYSTETKPKPFTLTAGLIKIECEAVKLKEGALLGSIVGEPGKNNEVIEFEKCKVSGTVEKKPIEKCQVNKNEPLVTRPVVSELVETEKAEPENKKGSLLTLFAPAEGTTFVTLKFNAETGGVCPPETKVSNEVIGQVLTDPNTPPTLGTLVSLESGVTEAKSFLINFPATPILKVTLIKGGVASQVTDKQLEAFGEPATLEGTALILLAKKEANGLLASEETNWAPVP